MSNSKLFADLADLAGGAVGVISSIKQQLRDETRERMDSFANRMDLVTRDDITRLEGMVTKLRTRIEHLEQQLGGNRRAAADQPVAQKKPATAKTSRKASAKKKKA